jgi:hypothetical protein
MTWIASGLELHPKRHSVLWCRIRTRLRPREWTVNRFTNACRFRGPPSRPSKTVRLIAAPPYMFTYLPSSLTAMEPQSSHDPLRRDGISPHLRLAPALMHIENLSLQSLARSTRGVGVTNLRDALEGRSSMSNPALVNKPPSLSTLEHASSHVDSAVPRLRPARSRSQKFKAAGSPSEVRDMLSKLHIGKSSNGSNLLRASFPLQKQDTR